MKTCLNSAGGLIFNDNWVEARVCTCSKIGLSPPNPKSFQTYIVFLLTIPTSKELVGLSDVERYVKPKII